MFANINKNLPTTVPTSLTFFPEPAAARSSVAEIIDLVEKPHNTRCLNPSCEGKSENCCLAPDFILSFYRVKRSKNHKEEICDFCYKKAVKIYDELSTAVLENELMLQVRKDIKLNVNCNWSSRSC